MIAIRAEQEHDAAAISALIERAFGQPDEARLVEVLRASGDAVVSLIAEHNRTIAGHVMLSAMSAPFPALGLAPLAVEPALQRQGIGAALVEAAVVQARNSGAKAIFVLGDPEYYGRFGFNAHNAAGFASPYAGSHFMALPLTDKLPFLTGSVDYAPAFAALG